MYRRPKFLEQLLEIRDQMSRDAFYDVDLFAEQVRSGNERPRSTNNREARAKRKVRRQNEHKK